MGITPGYEHDIFVSYAHVDDLDPGGGVGWVSQFVKHLELAIRQRLGGADALKIFFDYQTTGANYQLPELLRAVESSALFLAIGSPNYVAHAWPQREIEAFIRHAADRSRLFMIERMPLGEEEFYPPPLDSYVRLQFWKMSGKRPVPMPYSPRADAEEFQPLIHSLAADIRSQLLSLRLLSASRTKADPRTGPQLAARTGNAVDTAGAVPPAGGDRRTVLLAQATDDVEEEVDQLRRYLEQYEEKIIVLPRACYPQGGEAFRAALAQDLAQADVFVQLLGRRAGRVPPDLPEGYTSHQLEAARAKGVEIMQWRHPDLDVGAVSDPAYATVLNAETVAACGLEAFKRQVLGWLRRPVPKPAVARSAMVFINADSKDLPVARQIERECLQHALTTILPMAGPSSEANRKDLEDNLTDCDVLLFIYGDTTQDWIRSQLRFFSKVKPKREADPKLLAIYSGPPAEKPDIGITFPNAHLISCPDGWDLEPIKTLISERVG